MDVNIAAIATAAASAANAKQPYADSSRSAAAAKGLSENSGRQITIDREAGVVDNRNRAAKAARAARTAKSDQPAAEATRAATAATALGKDCR